jgi:hypothetical protein
MPPEEVEEGGLYPCWVCGAVRVFAADGSLRAPDEGERQFIDANSQVFYMRRFAALRRSLAAWCTAEGISGPGPDDVIRFFLSGAMEPPEPVSRPPWTQAPAVMIGRQVSMSGEIPADGNVVIQLLRPPEPEGPGPASLVCTAAEFARLSAHVSFAERERAALYFEGLLACYPEDIFIPGSGSPDSVAAAAMRHAYRQAAAIVREVRYPA